METHFNFLFESGSLFPNVRESLLGLMKKKTFRKGTLVVNQGEAFPNIFFVKKGILIESFTHDAEEVFTLLISEGYWYVPAGISRVTQSANFSIECLESCELYLFSKKELWSLSEGDTDLHNILNDLFITASLLECTWKKIAQMKKFEDRWKLFNVQFPDLAFRVPQNVLAPLLGVTPQYISMLRSRRKL